MHEEKSRKPNNQGRRAWEQAKTPTDRTRDSSGTDPVKPPLRPAERDAGTLSVKEIWARMGLAETHVRHLPEKEPPAAGEDKTLPPYVRGSYRPRGGEAGSTGEAATRYTKYQVSHGESLAMIAHKFELDPEALKEANPTLLQYYGPRRVAGFQAGTTILVPRKVLVEPPTEPRLQVSLSTATLPPVVRPLEREAAESPFLPQEEPAVPDPIRDEGPDLFPETTAPLAQEQVAHLPERTDAPVPDLREEEAPEKEANRILGVLETTGAGSATSRLDNHGLSGVEASERMAADDLGRMEETLDTFKKVGKEHGIPPALLAAIASRESRGGKALDSRGYGRSDTTGFGLMQVDVDSHEVEGGPRSETHIDHAAGILAGQWERVINDHPDWTEAQQLRGAIAAYNMDARNVRTLAGMDTGSTGNDYSSDVWARARYYAGLQQFGGEGQLSESISHGQGPGIRPGRHLSSSVGRADSAHPAELINTVKDVRFVQLRLVALGLMTESEAGSEFPALKESLPRPDRKRPGPLLKPEEEGTTAAATTPLAARETETEDPPAGTAAQGYVEEAKLENTIQAIATFQQKVMRKGSDGRIDPNGATIRALMATDAEKVTEGLATYAAHLAQLAAEEERRQAEAEAQREREREDRRKQQDAERQREIREKRKTELVKALKATRPAKRNYELLYRQVDGDLVEMAAQLRHYAPHNPRFVMGMIDHVGYLRQDNLAYHIVKNEKQLKGYPPILLAKLRDELREGILYSGEEHQARRIDAVLSGREEPAVSVEQERVETSFKAKSVADRVTFYGYRETDKSGCFRRAKEMLKSANFETTPSGDDKRNLSMTKYRKGSNEVLEVQSGIQEALNMINDHLDMDRPIIVGTNWKKGHTGNADGTTDHWIIIIARDKDDKGIFYRFYDPQTTQKIIGTSNENKLYLQKDKTLEGSYRVGSKYDRTYVVTMVRPSYKIEDQNQ